jgi:hypothetical protein
MAGQYSRYPVQGGGGGGTGDVVGPASSAQYQLAYYADTTGKLLAANASITASRALASDANGLPTASSVTATELGYLSGVTSAIQTQLNAKGAGTIGGSTGATDNAIQRADGTGGSTVQNSVGTIDDAGAMTFPNTHEIGLFYGSTSRGFVNKTLDYNGPAMIAGSYRLWLSEGGTQITGLRFDTGSAPSVFEFSGGTKQSIRARPGLIFNDGVPLHIEGGDTQGTRVGGPLTLRGGNAEGSGNGGDLNLFEGTSGSGTRGLITIGATASASRLRINCTVDATAGSISEYLTVNINGTDRKIAVYAV